MKIKVNAATNLQLDWMVAKCEEGRTHYQDYRVLDGQLYVMFCDAWLNTHYSPSTIWAQGGPIIERERISIRQWTNVPDVHAYMPNGEWSCDGKSPLIAAMRCLVASRLGDEVEVPEELV